jgi:5-deoxy-glucuronate isomerase
VGETPATVAKPVQFTPKDKVQVAIRGAGRESRQVHNLGMPDTLDADRMVVCEVIVPAGNWSGSPSHKHDCYVPGKESTLEEIYYFECAVTRGATTAASSPFGYFRGTSADSRPYDVSEEIHSGDVALVPYGWHGPAAAGPGYDLYFFNVMAGPDPERAWNATDHPDQAWIRQTWQSQQTDPRLPYGA